MSWGLIFLRRCKCSAAFLVLILCPSRTDFLSLRVWSHYFHFVAMLRSALGTGPNIDPCGTPHVIDLCYLSDQNKVIVSSKKKIYDYLIFIMPSITRPRLDMRQWLGWNQQRLYSNNNSLVVAHLYISAKSNEAANFLFLSLFTIHWTVYWLDSSLYYAASLVSVFPFSTNSKYISFICFFAPLQSKCHLLQYPEFWTKFLHSVR